MPTVAVVAVPDSEIAALTYFDFSDVAGAIETARVVVLMGARDPLFPLSGV